MKSSSPPGKTSGSRTSPKVKHVPLRSCVACRQVKPKGELVRLVVSPQGEISLDTVGKAPGRGAYLCLSLTCWSEGIKKQKIGHALRTTVGTEGKERLLALGKTLVTPGLPSS